MSEIESTALKRLQNIQERILESTPQLRHPKWQPKLDQSKESRPTSSNSIRKRRDPHHPNKLYEMEFKINELKKRINTEKETCKQLERDMKAREERYIRREKEYRKVLVEYETELRARMHYKDLSVDEQIKRNQNKIEGLHSIINENIGNIEKKTSQVLHDQKKDIKREFKTRMKEVNKDLEDERKKKLEGVGNFEETESKLTRELDLMKASMDLIEKKNKELRAENAYIRQECREQDQMRENILKEIVTIKRENARLQEELDRSKQVPIINIQTNSLSPGIPHTERFRMGSQSNLIENNSRYDSIITKLKHMLEIERKTLKSVRTAYAKEIESKTELEQVLKSCVEEVRAQNMRRTGNKKEEEFSALDREQVIELMLSQDKVLSLLYDRSFPSKKFEDD